MICGDERKGNASSANEKTNSTKAVQHYFEATADVSPARVDP